MPCAGLLLLAMLALAAPAAATPVRMFAVGHKVRLDDGTTYQSFHDKMAALMDAGFPGRASFVQAGADGVASPPFPPQPAPQATEPDLVALLRDPDEPSRTYAYEAVSPFPYNTTLVFAPDGEVLVPDGNGGTLESPSATGGVIRGSANKAYLTPIEQPPPGNQAGLSLAFGPVHDLEVLDTPVGRLAIVISKDAWMIDVNDRYLAKGANVVLQPEAFSEWAYAAAPWQPDIFKEGGFANLEKNVPWVANVDASMTGNFFDVTFDGQSAVLGRKRKRSPGLLGPGNAWIGQNPDTGFRIVAPWIEPDPGNALPALTLAARGSRTSSSPSAATGAGALRRPYA